MAYASPFKVANGLVLDFTVDNADTANDTFLGLNASGEVTKFASVPRSRVSGGGNLTEATSSVLTITGGTAAVLTSGLTIQVLQASGAQSGYLSSADWTMFNNKLGTSLTSAYVFVGNGSNVATGVAITGDIGITNAGVTSITAGAIVNADVNASAAIAVSKLAAVTASRVLGSDGSGFIQALDTATYPSLAELSYVKGVSSALQTQLNTKLTVTLTAPSTGEVITYDGANWVNSAAGTGVPAGGAANEILRKIDATNYNTEWHTLVAADLTDVSASAAELNLLSGVTTSTAQFNFSNTLVGNVQDQLNSKRGIALTENAIWIGDASNLSTELAAGANGYVLTSVSGVPTWATPGAGGTVTSVNGSGGTTGMSFTGGPITGSGTLTLTGTLAVANGGTNLTSYAIGDLIQATGATTLSKLASVSAGSYLRSGGVTTASAWSTVKLPDTMSALGLWVANSANTTVNLTAAAGQSVRVNAGGTAWEAYTPGAGSIGGSTGATDNAVLRADGTGGVTLQNSALIVNDSGDIQLGTSSVSSGTKTISVASSDATTGISIVAKGNSAINIYNDGTTSSIVNLAAATTGGLASFNFASNTSSHTLTAGNVLDTDNPFIITGRAGTASGIKGADLQLLGGNGSGTGNSAGGHIFARPGVKNGSSVNGNIGFMVTTLADWQDMEYGFYEANVTTAPTDNPASGIFRWVSSEPEGSNMKIRTSGGHFAKPVLQRKVTVSGGATLRGIGSTPVEIIPAPGANKFIHVISISVSYNYNSAVYNFGIGSNPTFQFTAGGIVSFMSAAQINGAADFNIKLNDATGVTTVGGAISPTNTALQLGTQDSGNATTGDGDIDVVVYYTIEDVNT